MKKFILLIISLVSLTNYSQNYKQEVTNVLDNWHLAATNVQFDQYMAAMTDDAIYIGTDANENWTKKAFVKFAKPYFDKGKAWSFKALQRNIYLSKDKKTAWFDELLNTQMKICRGSGILIKLGKTWKIQHYVLSMTIPNENSTEVIKIKTELEDSLIKKLEK